MCSSCQQRFSPFLLLLRSSVIYFWQFDIKDLLSITKSKTKAKITNRIGCTKMQSQSNFTTEGQAVCQSWCRAPFILCIEYCCLWALGCPLCGECGLSVDTGRRPCQLCVLAYTYIHIPCIHFCKCSELCTMCNICKASVSPAFVQRSRNASGSQHCCITSFSAVHQVADATRVQVPWNVWFMQCQSVLAETTAIPPDRGCLECEIWGRLSRQDGGQKETAHQEAASSESGL